MGGGNWYKETKRCKAMSYTFGLYKIETTIETGVLGWNQWIFLLLKIIFIWLIILSVLLYMLALKIHLCCVCMLYGFYMLGQMLIYWNTSCWKMCIVQGNREYSQYNSYKEDVISNQWFGGMKQQDKRSSLIQRDVFIIIWRKKQTKKFHQLEPYWGWCGKKMR